MKMGSDCNKPSDPFELIRNNKEKLEPIIDREDRIGAAARIVISLSQDERPSNSDLETFGIPVGPIGEFKEFED